MRRTIASLSLALLIAVPAVVPVAAVEPPTPSATPTAEPAATPTTEPQPTSTATPDATPTPDGTSIATPDATPAPSASAAATPAAEPAPTAEPSPEATEATEPPPTDPSASPAKTLPATTDDTKGRPDPRGRYIVVLKDSTTTSALVRRHGARDAIQPIRTFDRAIRGFTARLDPTQRRALEADPTVAAVVPDEVIEVASQITPTGVARIGSKYSATAKIDGIDQRVDADVAIIDTGIAKHPDLNVAGGYNCSTSDRSLWRDKEGHGTHVAGTVAALDNTFGVVGVAPGARLWAVKILNDDGYGLLSWYVCGLDWVLSKKDPTDASRPLIEAANMSVTKWGSDDHACGTKNADILHKAICRVVAGGITVVAAAANDSGSASKRVPASYNEVITVSALADTDGKPGALGGKRCYSWGTYDTDDTYANFSNYGGDVDIIAPGKCIWSTKPGNTYAYSSGTSMAAPAVTGAVALYKATRPKASPAEVKEALQYLGNLKWKTSTDPDSTHEKLLDVSKVAKLGTFSLSYGSPSKAVAETGGTLTVPVKLTRSTTFFERVRLAVTAVPTGWTATLSSASLMGWTANAATLSVTVPSGLTEGTYDVKIQGTNQGRVKTMTVPVAVTNDVPTAATPTAQPVRGTQIGVNGSGTPTSVTMRVLWPAATDPSSDIAAYQLDRRVDGGDWQRVDEVDGTARSIIVSGLSLAATHRFRVRAEDAVGNWSPWVESIDYSFQTIGDRSSTLTYGGTWKRAAVDSATNAVRTTTTQAGATVRRTITGREIALVMPRSRVRGKVTVTIDGVLAATVDTYYKSTQARRVAWWKTWSSSATHTVVLRVSGTAGRPTVSLDGIIVVK